MFDRNNVYANGCGGKDEDYEKNDMFEIFERIYQTDLWVKYAKKEDPNTNGGDGSGYGSEPKNSAEFLEYLSNKIKNNSIESIVDFGCGSHYMYNEYVWPDCVKTYTGYDISKTAISRANKNCKHQICNFIQIQDYNDIQSADLLIVKDVFQHWPERFAIDFLENNIDKFKHIIICGNPQETVQKKYFDWDEAKQLSYSEHQLFYKNNG